MFPWKVQLQQLETRTWLFHLFAHATAQGIACKRVNQDSGQRQPLCIGY